MKKNKWFLLQLFAGEGAGASGGEGGSEGAATGENDGADAGYQRLRELGVPEEKLRKRAKRANVSLPEGAVRTTPMEAPEQKAQEQVATAAENPTEEKTENPAPARMSWDEIMADPEYNQQMQAVVKSRLKAAGAAEEALAKLTPALKVLARKHGIDTASMDYDAIAQAINSDDANYEEKAMEMGVSVDTLRSMDQRKFEEEQQQKQKLQEHFRSLEQQGEALKKVFPNFDLRAELQNPAFARMTAPGTGIMSVEDAYKAVHRKELEAAQSQVIAQQTAQKISNAIQAGSRRPDENGTSGQSASVTAFNYAKASKAQRDALKQQIRAAAARGEKLYPGR